MFQLRLTSDELDRMIYVLRRAQRRAPQEVDALIGELRCKLEAAREEGPDDDGFVARSPDASPSMPTTHFSMRGRK